MSRMTGTIHVLIRAVHIIVLKVLTNGNHGFSFVSVVALHGAMYVSGKLGLPRVRMQCQSLVLKTSVALQRRLAPLRPARCSGCRCCLRARAPRTRERTTVHCPRSLSVTPSGSTELARSGTSTARTPAGRRYWQLSLSSAVSYGYYTALTRLSLLCTISLS